MRLALAEIEISGDFRIIDNDDGVEIACVLRLHVGKAHALAVEAVDRQLARGGALDNGLDADNARSPATFEGEPDADGNRLARLDRRLQVRGRSLVADSFET